MPAHTCPKCGKEFTDKSFYNRHINRKTPCAPVLNKEDLPEEKRDSPNRCKFCGRVFSTPANMARHMKKSCKITPREGNEGGMEKLYQHTLRKQLEQQQQKEVAQQKKMEALEAQVAALTAMVTGGSQEVALLDQGSTPAKWGERAVVQNRLAGGEPYAAPSAKTVQAAHVTNVATGGAHNSITNIDASIGKTVNNVTINVFGAERLDKITKPQVVDLLRSLGPVGENVKAIAEKAIIQAAMLIFSDPARPEDITCYLPNKKGDDALVHGEAGWEVQPVGLVISPMAAQSIEVLFKHQPAPDQHTPEKDVKWMMEECGNIMRYIAQHEGDMTNEPPRGEMRGILIRNKDLLQQVLAKLPMAGQK